MLPARPLVASLARIPFFAGLDESALERVAAGTRTRRFRRGEVIFHAGDPGDALFIIVSGEVKIALPSETGDEAIIASLRPGDVFGELALLDGAPRSATATALTATETVVLPRDGFRDLIATEPHVRDALLASLAGELRRLTRHVEELHFLDMTGRVAARLVRLAEEAGPAVDDGVIRLRPSLTQSRARVDGRLHAAEREQAARPVRRRGPGPARSRGDRGHRPEGARLGFTSVGRGDDPPSSGALRLAAGSPQAAPRASGASRPHSSVDRDPNRRVLSILASDYVQMLPARV